MASSTPTMLDPSIYTNYVNVHLCKGRHKCDHCVKISHKSDKYYALHGRPPRSVAVAQIALVQPSTMDSTSFDTPS